MCPKKKIIFKTIRFSIWPFNRACSSIQLANQIHESFENNLYTLGVFIGLSKAFDTVNHSIILKTLETYGTHGKNLEWFKSYLRNRKQYIQIDDKNKTNF